MAHDMQHHDVAYFLQVFVPNSTPENLDTMTEDIGQVLESEGICTHYGDQEPGEEFTILHYDCDGFGGTVTGLDEGALISVFQKLSSRYPDAYFDLYAEDEDDGKQNSSYVFRNGQHRVDHSILIDSEIQLEPQKAAQYVITAVLDEDSLEKVKTLLNFIGFDYVVEPGTDAV